MTDERLNSRPDWAFLLRDVYEHYRTSSAGGSPRIRTHQRHVRERIGRALNGNPQFHVDVPETLPVCRFLARALSRGYQTPAQPIIRSVEAIVPLLSWRYGYDRMPRSLADKYAYAEIMGPNGPVVWEDLIVGLVLFAPRTVYPTHRHTGITESYVCLSGAVSQNDAGVYAPGSLIFNPPGHMHRITTADREPCLLAYCWVGTPEDLRHQEMAFSRARRPEGGVRN
ncbi:dimethylsulfonioproprionate lyase family protein [Dichotomicrobium thermohalophilum]|uniref:Dimethylsulfoniopropionate lyase DddL n=1 Tax=Dichotomicrobium thermohalophilum TaxID=933063 RepID=A0A397PGW8_9HYPH|nr:dimethylsulfonioproprionate lyase family protein [Dichotomicrobium thermohalophilum]RIA47733.1 dimethylsulfoniopropionate lyase DddL [Dichotomicrobium thermohalophilum]